MVLGNYLIPIYVGSPEIIFPRLNNCSVVFTSLSLVIMLLALLTEYSIGPGWTLYPPLSLYPVNTTVLVVLGLTVSGLGTLVTSINYILTAFHTLILADLFVPAMIITSIMLVFVLPVLTGALLLIISDMYFNTIFWKGIINGNSGDPILFQHIFWWSNIEPHNIERYYMNIAICLDPMSSFFMYYVVSLLVANIVTIMLMVGNEQVTNSAFKENSVGTSETLRNVPSNRSPGKVSHDSESKRFNEWLAGYIDGRGNLLVNNSGTCGLELVTDQYDQTVLLQIKNKLGGSIQSRVRNNSFRYFLRYDKQIIDLIHRINGNIRSSQRTPQFILLCSRYNIPYISPQSLTNSNSWYSGYYDSLGNIDCSRSAITVSLSTKHEIDIKLFNTGPFAGGSYQYVRSGSGYYIWSTSDKLTVLDLYNYFKLYPSRTNQLQRIKLIPQFYTLQSDQTQSLDKLWSTFLAEWGERVKTKSNFVLDKTNTLTTAELDFLFEDKQWNEWLAGFIDGDGHIRVSGGHCFLDIPQETKNLHVLKMIQEKLGGTIKKVNNEASPNTYRYYLGDKSGMLQFAHRVNGNIRGVSRVPQFIKLCTFLDIKYVPAVELTIENAWFSGMFDSDGTILASFKSSRGITLKVTSKYSADVELFLPLFGGSISKQPTSYDWLTANQTVVMNACNYLTTLYSVKNHRVNLVSTFYNLRSLRAYLPDSPRNSEWRSLEADWNKYKSI